MTTVTAIRRTRPKPKAQHKLPAGPVLPLGKQLAHTDKKVRDAAFANVTEFLSNGGITKLTAPIEDAHGMIAAEGEEPSERDVRRGQLPPVEMRRLWKGLFYCFWMSDKPLVQQRLATDLSSVVLEIDPKSTHDEDPLARDMAALDFIQGFWEAIIREWIGIDRFRMDKYYMLLRRWINASFRLLARSEWNDQVVNRYNTIMADPVNGPLAWSNPRTPVSLAWHLADIWVEELDKVLRQESTPAPVPTLLHPFTQLLTRTPNAQSPPRLLSSIYTPILAASIPDSNPLLAQHSAKRRKTTATDADPREKVAGILKSHASTSEERLGRDLLGALMREAGRSDEEGVRDVNRRKVYAFVRDWGGADEEDSEEEEDEDEDDDDDE
ncbi:hypothetical protein NliqN6_5853 [Naganishia liquefaciens]|uniref:Nop52-domain-containing protein n=1 Tax=Naganishia liquefaciens TaxID=104408 RepID=A0A8H3TYY2_9TREE|nr:hypothetical protein NliqN6_5853 [Naganishia liquefaciens]